MIYPLRLEPYTIKRLESLSKCLGINTADLMRRSIENTLNNGMDINLRVKVIKIIEKLKGPFLYVRNKLGKEEAKRERKIRGMIIKKLEEDFFLK